METDLPRWRILTGYAGTGLAAGLATCISGHWLALLVGERLLDYFLGGVFGLFLAAYLWLFRAQRSMYRALTLILMSAAAYFAAVYVGGLAEKNWPPIHIPLLGIDPAEARIMVAGGLAGALVLFPAFNLVFCSSTTWDKFAVKLVLATLTSAALGLLGWALWPSVGRGVWFFLRTVHLGEPSQATLRSAPQDTAEFYSLYVIWQCGFSCLLAILCGSCPPAKSSDAVPGFHVDANT